MIGVVLREKAKFVPVRPSSEQTMLNEIQQNGEGRGLHTSQHRSFFC